MKKDRIYLEHIIESIEKIKEYTSHGREAFLNTPMMQDAVIRNFEIIGEATKKISVETKSSYPDIPWRKVAGLRDVLIHDYMGVDLIEVWNIIEKDLQELEKLLRKIYHLK